MDTEQETRKQANVTQCISRSDMGKISQKRKKRTFLKSGTERGKKETVTNLVRR